MAAMPADLNPALITGASMSFKLPCFCLSADMVLDRADKQRPAIVIDGPVVISFLEPVSWWTRAGGEGQGVVVYLTLY